MKPLAIKPLAIKPLAFGSTLLALLSLIVSFGLVSFWPGMVIAGGTGGLWLVAQWRGWRHLDSPLLAVGLGLAGLAVWQGASLWLPLMAVMASLATWDLTHFERHLAASSRVDELKSLHRRHLRRLAGVALLSLLLGGLALNLSIPLNLAGAMVLGLLTIVALGRVVGGARSKL